MPPHIVALPSYMKESFELLKRIKGPQLPLGSILVTIDVESLYYSIPHDWEIQIVGSFLRETEQA